MSRKICVSLAVLIASLFVNVAVAHSLESYWAYGGIPVCPVAGGRASQALLPDGTGGAFVAWMDQRSVSGDYGHVYVQKIAANGDYIWNENGVAVCTAPDVYFFQDLSLASDNDGGVIISWHDGRTGFEAIYAQRVGKDGLVKWTTNGVPIWSEADATYDLSATMPDNCGGAIIVGLSPTTLELLAQRISADGVPRWSGHLAICDDLNLDGPYLTFGATADGEGGAYVSWIGQNYKVKLKRIDANGASLWNTVVSTPASGHKNMSPRLTLDGEYGRGEVIVAWFNIDETIARMTIYAQKYGRTGEIAVSHDPLSTWNWARNENGVQVSQPFEDDYEYGHYPPQMVPDDHVLGGAVFCWEDRSGGDFNIYAQHLVGNGYVGWNPNGEPICTAVGNQMYPSMALYRNRGPLAQNDSTGVYIVWEDYRTPPAAAYIQRISLKCHVAQGAPGGDPIWHADDEQSDPVITDGGIVVYHGSGSGSGLYAQKYQKPLGYPLSIDGEDAVSSAPHSCDPNHNPSCPSESSCYYDLTNNGVTYRGLLEGDLDSIHHWVDSNQHRRGLHSIGFKADAQSSTCCHTQRDEVVFMENMPFGPTMYTGFSLKITSENPVDPSIWQSQNSILMQWFQTNIVAYPLLFDLIWNPVDASLELQVQIRNEDHLWNGTCVVGGGCRTLYQEDFPINEWVDFVVGYKFNPKGCGWAKIWRNGETKPAWEYTEQVGFPSTLVTQCPDTLFELTNLQQSIYHYKFGIYRTPQNRTLEAYFDEVRFGLSYEEVVPPPALYVNDPNGGEVLIAGRQDTIRWDGYPGGNEVTGVEIRYSTDGGNSYPNVITSSTPNDGEYVWTVPQINSTACRVKIILHGVSSTLADDTSDSDFTIQQLVADWRPNGVAVSVAPGIQENLRLIPDGSGGTIIVWQDKRNGSDYNVYAQRIGSGGDPMWTANGKAICTAANDQVDPQLCTDGSGGAVIVWTDCRNGTNQSDIYAQRISASGDVQWTENGVPICVWSQNQAQPQIAFIGGGNVIIAWLDYRTSSQNDIYAQKVNAGGQVQWTANGKAISTLILNQDELRMILDGAGGVYMAYRHYDTSPNLGEGIGALRLTGSGTVSWERTVCKAVDAQKHPDLTQDGSGGVIIVWEDDRYYSARHGDIYGQRLNQSGSAQWTTNGVAICSNVMQQSYPRIAPDGSGHFFVTWQDNRNGSYNYDIYAASLALNGTIRLLEPWEGDIPIAMASGWQVNCRIVPMCPSGVIVSWDDNRSGNYDVYAQALGDDGSFGWATNGLPVCYASLDQSSHELCADVTGTAFFAWKDMRNGVADIYAQRISPNPGPEEASLRPGITPSPAPENALENNYPNPFNPTTTIKYSIAESGPVNLAIYNVNGQLVRTLVNEVKQKNFYRVVWDGRDDRGVSVASGIYFCKIKAGRFSKAEKLVLLR